VTIGYVQTRVMICVFTKLITCYIPIHYCTNRLTSRFILLLI